MQNMGKAKRQCFLEKPEPVKEGLIRNVCL